MIRHLGIVLGAAVLLAGCGTGDTRGSGPSATSGSPTSEAVPTMPRTADPAAPGTTPHENVRSCAELIDAGWQPPPEEAPDLSWDPATGILHLTFTGEQLVLNIKTDAKCQELPVVGPMIKRALANDTVPAGQGG